jgi:large subunit ribosomal protein L9
MDIILLQKVANLGQIGDRVKVKAGYARNFLVPTGKANAELAAAQKRAADFENFKLELKAKAGTEGKLFGSIGTADIAEAAAKAGHPISRSEVRMPNGPIRTTGEHQVQLHLHTDVGVTLTVTIVAEE